MSERTDVAVVGAGILGLATARELLIRHPEQLVQRLRRFLDGLNYLMCRRDGEPGWAQERPDKAQPRDMTLVVLRLRRRGPNALVQQVFPQIELDRRDWDAGLRREFRNSHGTPWLDIG